MINTQTPNSRPSVQELAAGNINSMESPNLGNLDWAPEDTSYQTRLQQEEQKNKPTAYFVLLHPSITVKMRAILYNWLSEVCSHFTMKRSTYWRALYIIDFFLTCTKDLRADKYQLVGTACLLIAAKLEEVSPPPINALVKAADYAFWSKDIQCSEKIVLSKISWHALKPTCYDAVDWLIFQWDSFVGLKHMRESLYLKQPAAYRDFREIMRTLDSVSLDSEALKYSRLQIASSLLFIALQKMLRTEENGIIQEFFMTVENVNEECVHLCGIHVDKHFVCELPLVCQLLPKSEIENNYDEFLGYHTHSYTALGLVKKVLESRMN